MNDRDRLAADLPPMPRTEAGKRLLAEDWENFDSEPWGSIADHVAAIEAEAVAAERARLADAVQDFVSYVPVGRLRKGGMEAWHRLEKMLEPTDA